MQFSVIYSFDCPRGVSVKWYLPDGCYRKAKANPWQLTEGDEQYDYGYLEGDWARGKHRKFCGLLTDEQWQAFASDKCLAVECRNTLGMIGAPGAGLGCLPAVAFHTPDDEAIVSCYAFPLGTRADCVQFLTRMGYEVPAIFTDIPGQAFLWGDEADYAGNSFDVMVDAFIEFTESGYPDPSELEQAA